MLSRRRAELDRRACTRSCCSSDTDSRCRLHWSRLTGRDYYKGGWRDVRIYTSQGMRRTCMLLSTTRHRNRERERFFFNSTFPSSLSLSLSLSSFLFRRLVQFHCRRSTANRSLTLSFLPSVLQKTDVPSRAFTRLKSRGHVTRCNPSAKRHRVLIRLCGWLRPCVYIFSLITRSIELSELPLSSAFSGPSFFVHQRRLFYIGCCRDGWRWSGETKTIANEFAIRTSR